MRVRPCVFHLRYLMSSAVIVLELRRIAARLAARRIALEMGEAIRETVRYQVRFEEVTGPRTPLS